MRTVFLHVGGLLVTLVLYCLIVPQAREELFAPDLVLRDKATGVIARAVGIYVCFLFVYYAFFRERETPDMPDQGAYGGYADDDEEPGR